MSTTAIQLYTLRNIDESLPSLLDRVGETNFDGVEFAHRFADADTTAVADALDRTGLEAVSAHVGIEALESDLEGTIEAYDEIGCDTLVVPWLDQEHFADIDAVTETATRLTNLAEQVSDSGGTLHYHNHDHELVAVEGQTALDELVQQSSDALGIEVDTGWVEAGGSDPAAFIETYANRIDLVHITDCDAATATPVEVGTGDVDIEQCLDAARANDVTAFVYEHDEPNDPLESLEHGATVLDR